VPEPPPPGTLPTCDTAGIIGPAALVVGGVQAAEAIKLLVGEAGATAGRMLACDLWEGSWRQIDLSPLAENGCPTCRQADFPWLEGRRGGTPTALCGRDAVQVAPAGAGEIDLASLAERLRGVGRVTANPWLVRVDVESGVQLSVFADGRVIVTGTREEAKARAIVARYVGQ
jgi:adenylyltransferase/sulfurtransferase